MARVTGIGGVFIKPKTDDKALREWYQRPWGGVLRSSSDDLHRSETACPRRDRAQPGPDHRLRVASIRAYRSPVRSERSPRPLRHDPTRSAIASYGDVLSSRAVAASRSAIRITSDLVVPRRRASRRTHASDWGSRRTLCGM